MYFTIHVLLMELTNHIALVTRHGVSLSNNQKNLNPSWISIFGVVTEGTNHPIGEHSKTIIYFFGQPRDGKTPFCSQTNTVILFFLNRYDYYEKNYLAYRH